jgi:hypothetical protein
MRTIKIHFLDWYDWILPGSSNNNIFTWILGKHFNLEFDSVNPDILFYSLSHNSHLKYNNCLKIFVNAEPGSYNDLSRYPQNDRTLVSIQDADYTLMSYHLTMEKNFYFPITLLWLYHHIFVTKIFDSIESLTKPRNFYEKNNFCVFLHNNYSVKKRNELFTKLNNYKKITTKSDFSFGRNYDSISKVIKFREYGFKFSFAIQNHYYTENHVTGNNNPVFNVPGLIDEKITESFFGNTIPIFYGNEDITKIFNKDSFINYHEYNNDEDFISKIIEIDNNDKLFYDMSTQPIIKNIEDLGLENLENFLLKIIN